MLKNTPLPSLATTIPDEKEFIQSQHYIFYLAAIFKNISKSESWDHGTTVYE